MPLAMPCLTGTCMKSWPIITAKPSCSFAKQAPPMCIRTPCGGDYRMNIVEHAITSQTDGTSNDLPFFYTGKTSTCASAYKTAASFNGSPAPNSACAGQNTNKAPGRFPPPKSCSPLHQNQETSLIGVDTTFWIPDDFYDGRESQILSVVGSEAQRRLLCLGQRLASTSNSR